MKAIEHFFPVFLFTMLYKVVQAFESVDGIHMKVWPFKWKLLSNNFLWYCLLYYTQLFTLLSPWTKTFFRVTTER